MIQTNAVSSVSRRTLARCDVPVVEGPVERTGATGPMLSAYVRDHDGNLVEIGNRVG